MGLIHINIVSMVSAQKLKCPSLARLSWEPFQLGSAQLGKFQLELIRYHVTMHGELFSKLKIQFSHILRMPQIFKKIFQLTKNVKSNWEIFLKFLRPFHNIWTLIIGFATKNNFYTLEAALTINSLKRVKELSPKKLHIVLPS